jgi:hypothetical protein
MKKGRTFDWLDSVCRFLTDYRKPILVVILIITAIFLYGSFGIRGRVILQDMLPYDHPYLKLHNRFSEVFGSGGSTLAIALRTKQGDVFNEAFLKKLQDMTKEVMMWEDVYRSLTVSIATRSVKVVKPLAKGEINIDPIMWPEVPHTPEDMAILKKNILSSPAYNGSLVSRDADAALLLTEVKENISYEDLFKKLRQLTKDYTDDKTSVHIVGYPMLMGWIYSLKPQMYKVFAISVFAIALVLIIIFRNFPGMISPLVNAGILTIWGLGFIGFTRINFNPMLYVLAFLVGSRMIGNSHQLAYRYFEELDSAKGDRTKAAYETMRTMFVPNFAAVVADVAGFSVLFLAKIALMQHLAIIMSFWMATILMTGFMVPAVCSVINLKVDSAEWDKEKCQTDWKARMMMAITKFSIAPGSRWIVAALIVLVTVLSFWETSKLKIGDPTPGSPVFYQDHTYNKDTAIINKGFDASSENFLLYYEGSRESVYDPEVMLTFEEFDRWMQERLPDIYKSPDSLINTVKMVNVTLHDGDWIWFQLVRKLDLLTGLMGWVKQSTDPATLARYIDRPLQRAQLTLYFADHTSDNLLRIRDAAYAFFKTHPTSIRHGEFKLAGGRIGMEIALNEEMKRSHLLIDLAVYLAIFLLCALSYWSFVAGLMLTLPLILANSVAGAYMHMMGIGLSINTLPIAAIGAGLGVDFAIYLYSRAIEEYALEKGDWYETMIQSICTCGKAVVYTGVTVILPILTWYIFSEMKFQAQVGFFLSLIMATNVVLCLTLHPLVIFLVKPKFISKHSKAITAEAETAGAM